VENVVIDQVNIITYNDDMENGAYIKTWIGELAPQSSYESAGQPRGGGWGNVSNIVFSNFNLTGPTEAIAINQDSGNNGSFSGTSNMLVSNITFANFSGYSSDHDSSISCSTRHPCYNINFENFHVLEGEDSDEEVTLTCKWVEDGGVHGYDCS
jgi:galacturan 1,4-alpha-galacturonidase